MKVRVFEILILLFFVVPVVKLIMDEFTDPGGMIETVAPTFDLATWKFFPIGLGLLGIGFLIFLIVRRISGEGKGEE